MGARTETLQDPIAEGDTATMGDAHTLLEQARTAFAAAERALRLAEEAAGAAPSSPTVSVERLVAQRVDIVEDDGTLRLSLGNSTFGDTLPTRGELRPHPGRMPAGGLLFVNDEGTESGALVFHGRRGPNGVAQGGYFAFDDYEQNESFRFGHVQEGTDTIKFVEFVDQPSWSIIDLADELSNLPPDAQAAHVQRVQHEQGQMVSRMRLAREGDGSVQLVLRDAKGRDRLRAVVPAEGTPRLELLDADGGVTSLA